MEISLEVANRRSRYFDRVESEPVTGDTRYRCKACGNLTRFDVFETRRSRRFHHYSLGGALTVEEEEVLDSRVERVSCRWCGSSESIEEVPHIEAEA